ncbi:MAG TPA: hypothetical protein VFU29_18305 [Chitinophagaceae bacterium]|nr:hypothetical protein [Chitinophagaceae bacterium]
MSLSYFQTVHNKEEYAEAAFYMPPALPRNDHRIIAAFTTTVHFNSSLSSAIFRQRFLATFESVS